MRVFHWRTQCSRMRQRAEHCRENSLSVARGEAEREPVPEWDHEQLGRLVGGVKKCMTQIAAQPDRCARRNLPLEAEAELREHAVDAEDPRDAQQENTIERDDPSLRRLDAAEQDSLDKMRSQCKF